MNSDLTTDERELIASEPPYQGKKLLPKRNLGSAILLAAVQDYQNVDDGVHAHAAAFLYPQTWRNRRQYEWAVALAEGVDPAWLRESLDRLRSQWDRGRARRKSRKRQQARSVKLLERHDAAAERSVRRDELCASG